MSPLQQDDQNKDEQSTVSKTKVFVGKMLVLYRFPNDAETLGS